MTDPAVSEKQAELDALQTAFDDYIASSRELEEELDAELTKCQQDLDQAESRNSALASQLANVSPQLNSIESKLSTVTSQLKQESQRRIQAEMACEDAENKMREVEGTLASVRSSELRKIKEENEDLCERLAFIEGEVEDYRNELDTERERHRGELEEVKEDLDAVKMRLTEREKELEDVQNKNNTIMANNSERQDADQINCNGADNATADDEEDDEDSFDEEAFLPTMSKKSFDDDAFLPTVAKSSFDEEAFLPNIPETDKQNNDDDIFDDEVGETAPSTPLESGSISPAESPVNDKQVYIKTLEDELEQYCEMLIETEKKLSQTQADLEEALIEAEEAHKQLEAMGDAQGATEEELIRAHDEKIAELESVIRNLREENAALEEDCKHLKDQLEKEIEAYEEDTRIKSTEFETAQKQYAEEIATLQGKLDKVASEDRSREIESKEWEEAMKVSKEQAQKLQEEVERLELALKNSKADCEALQGEMEELTQAFDDTAILEKQESDGQHEAFKELLATRSREVEELKGEMNNLADTNASLTKMLKDTEEHMKKEHEEIVKQQQEVATESASSSKELTEAKNEIKTLESSLEEVRVELAEQQHEVEKVRASLEEKFVHVQKELETAEGELEATRSKIDEMESTKREIPLTPRRKIVRLSLSDSPLRRARKKEGEDVSESDFYQSHALSRRLFSHKSRSRPRSCSPTTIQRLEGDAEQRVTVANSLQNECDRLEDQNRMSVSMKNHLEDDIIQLKNQLAAATSGQQSSSIEDETDPTSDLHDMNDNIEDVLQSNNPDMIAEEFRSLAKKVSTQKTHNAELLARILKLQGNIQVCCRIRPMSSGESQKGLHEVAQSLSETEVGCFDERTQSWKSYAFDKVWGPETKQPDVFQDVEPMALSVIDGFNSCIFAYGQTGSGKTYTMEGDKENGRYGISQRTVQKIFGMLQDRAKEQQNKMKAQGDLNSFEYDIEIGMLEIYNDEGKCCCYIVVGYPVHLVQLIYMFSLANCAVYDLLDPNFSGIQGWNRGSPRGSPQKRSLDVRHGGDNVVDVPDLRKEQVNSVSDVLLALDRGNTNRAKAATNLNEHSSRSHMILRVDVTSGVGETKNKGTLYLVDLAGSERVRKSEVEGQALKEAQHINKSLSALGNVMEALDRKSSHVPYRDSKLTHLLQNALGGNSRTMMVVTVCPHNNAYDETAFALKFATRVRRINLGSAQKNVMAKNLEESVKNLTSELSAISKAKERSESQLMSLKREKDRVEEKLAKASVTRASSKGETKTLNLLKQSNDDITARWQKEKVAREETAAELEKTQEALRRVQKDLSSLKHKQESLSRHNEEKENVIFDLKKNLRSVKEQFNEEKIRHRRDSVIQSRIPAPSARRVDTTIKQSPYQQHPSGLKRPTSTRSVVSTKAEPRTTTVSDSTSAARIRFRVLKMLQENDPTKADKIDIVMNKFKGRETELLDRMVARYETKNNDEDAKDDVITSAESTTSNDSNDGRPKSRQDVALERHMNRMNRIRAAKGLS